MVWKNIFQYRPDEAAMFGSESLSTAKNYLIVLYVEKLLKQEKAVFYDVMIWFDK